MNASASAARGRFVVAILAGSFLLFLVQPLVARLALPRLGGAPNVWNSAMLVYQALLLAGYAYAHRLGRLSLRRQATVHLAVLLVAALTLPLGLVELTPARAGLEALWVPLLFLLSVGPVFVAVSAQAPLLQRWYTSHPAAGEPWALYAASNLGSFAGLIAYPVFVEPLLPLRAQSLAWSFAYGILIALVAWTAMARWRAAEPVGGAPNIATEAGPRPSAGTIGLWLGLSAVPSGLMLSTTTHLTTDIFAMPLLWVIPLGLYLLSFVVAFSDKQDVAWAFTVSAPLIMLLGGGMAMLSRPASGLSLVFASIALLFVVCVALHSRLYSLRPAAGRLTLFYLVMSAGGALGGLFTALIAPLVFDWTWEHPLLVFAAAALLPLPSRFDWRELGGYSAESARAGALVIVLAAAIMAYVLSRIALEEGQLLARLVLTAGTAICGMLLLAWRALYLAVLLMLMLAQGGWDTVETSREGLRSRSYFGVYTLREYPGVRMLAHGTTLHGQQFKDPAVRLLPTSYYGPTSGAGIVLGGLTASAPAARIGVVGLGTGTLACYRRPGQAWTFFEIDPAVLAYSRNGTFTYSGIL